jgi:hypothetical protein
MTEPLEYVELPVSAADRERFRQIAEQAAVSLEARRDGFHVITERAEGPDLDDLVRLIRYLRDHDFAVRFDYSRMRPTLSVTWELYADGNTLQRRYTVTESDRVGLGRFVGPDGTVYDANREAL